MKTRALVWLLLSTAVVVAQQPDPYAGARQVSTDPNGIQRFTAEEFAATAKTVEQAMATGRATHNFLNVATHRLIFVAVSSKSTPPAELHLAETDVWIIKSGPGWVQLGGEITDPRSSTSPSGGKQFVGSAIRGGQKFRANVGDIINIPPNVAHQALLDPGESMSYFVLKVKEPVATSGPAAR